ncbi:MAG: metallophosphoesterase [Polyangiaceae bacterium]|nr:metallophosphoesterase [Polyangiaceae bacterium]
MPPGGTRLVLLHISDLHFCDPTAKGHYWNTEATELAVAPHNRRGLLGSLLYDLRHEKIKPDLVVVSGDLLDRGSASGVPLAISFLRGLAEGLGLPTERIVIAPGNHDVLRDGDHRYKHYDEIRNALYGSARAAFAPDTPAHQRVDHHVFDSQMFNQGIEVVAFNSCEELDAAQKRDHGSVGIGQRDFTETFLQRTEDDKKFRIAVMHHHLESPEGTRRTDYSVMEDAAGTRRWLARHHFSIALHGHQHVDWQVSFDVDGWSLAVASAASAGVAEYGRKEWSLAIAYQAIVVESSTRGRRIRREYNPQTMEWADAGRGEDVQVLRFGPVDENACHHEEHHAHAHVEPSPPSLTRLGRVQVKIKHIERAIESHRMSFRVQVASVMAAACAAVALAFYLIGQLSPVLSVSGGLALLFAGSIALPMRLASYRDVHDKLQFLADGYRRCTTHWDDKLVQMLDERFHRMV